MAPSIADPAALAGFRAETIREVVFSSAGGSMVRVQLTNAFGTRPLLVGGASIALAGPGATLQPGTVRVLTFADKPSVRIAPGANALSDPVRLDVPALSRLTVSIFVPNATGPATLHAQSREINYIATGDHLLDPDAGSFGHQLATWYFLDGIDVLAPPRYLGAVVALGDSITAGVGSDTDADANWPDDLARRLTLLPGSTLSVVDQGIGGNRVLNGSECCGPSALTRFGADVLGQLGVRDVILLEGINDIGFSQQRTATTLPHTDVSAAQIIAGDEQLIAAAHAAGLRILGATLLPFEGARYWTPAGQAKLDAVNHWIRTSGAFDGVLDFAAVVADPSDPNRLNPAFDSGDHLHPNDAGYQAMADAIPLSMLLGGPDSNRSAA